MRHRGNAHEFALYVAQFPKELVEVGDQLLFSDALLVHRISRVLRLDINDKLFLFTQEMHVTGLIQKIDKRHVHVSVIAIERNRVLQPCITLYLPLLKREALEQAMYSAVELGVNRVQLIKTEKVQKQCNEHEFERLQHIMIAAAEQSKSFLLPTLVAPILLTEILFKEKSLFFDPSGEPLFDVIKELKQQPVDAYALMVGPEGDLTETEKFFLQQNNVVFTRLTPTVLRSQQAVAVAVGLFRSIFSLS